MSDPGTVIVIAVFSAMILIYFFLAAYWSLSGWLKNRNRDGCNTYEPLEIVKELGEKR